MILSHFLWFPIKWVFVRVTRKLKVGDKKNLSKKKPRRQTTQRDENIIVPNGSIEWLASAMRYALCSSWKLMVLNSSGFAHHIRSTERNKCVDNLTCRTNLHSKRVTTCSQPNLGIPNKRKRKKKNQKFQIFLFFSFNWMHFSFYCICLPLQPSATKWMGIQFV